MGFPQSQDPGRSRVQAEACPCQPAATLPSRRPPTHRADASRSLWGLHLTMCRQQGLMGQAWARQSPLSMGPQRASRWARTALTSTHTHTAASRHVLNIVLGATLGLDMAVVHFFGDYLDLECWRTERQHKGTGLVRPMRAGAHMRGPTCPSQGLITRPPQGQPLSRVWGLEHCGQDCSGCRAAHSSSGGPASSLTFKEETDGLCLALRGRRCWACGAG